MSAGMSSTVATDYYILNENATKAGYLKSDYISPMVGNDALTPEGAE
jgi:predicted ATP-grasp superfamily ATP-dependent carboligase